VKPQSANYKTSVQDIKPLQATPPTNLSLQIILKNSTVLP